jgi:hypothetical protein
LRSDKDDVLARQFPLLDAASDEGEPGSALAEGESDVATLEEGLDGQG